jgi:aspartate/tyrosine/aromatic aminotransferase
LIEQAQFLIFGFDITTRLKDQSNASIQTVSGIGANHMAALFLSQHLHLARVFILSPTWINHRTIWAMAEVQVHNYLYYAPETQAVNLAGMLAVLENTAKAHDVVILQVCAHNLTGVDLSQTQWARIMDVVKRKKLFVVFDIAYSTRALPLATLTAMRGQCAILSRS